MNLLYSIRNEHMESFDFVIDISQDDLALGPKEFLRDRHILFSTQLLTFTETTAAVSSNLGTVTAFSCVTFDLPRTKEQWILP